MRAFEKANGRGLLAVRAPVALRAGRRPIGYGSAKRVADIVVACLGLPVVCVVALALLILNPFFNPGPLIFTQRRFGLNRREFTIFKFRSMRPDKGEGRGPEDPLEVDRITPLGGFIRRTRLDELPQLVNVLRGEMSIIGPRPDAAEHADKFCKAIDSYSKRFAVRPGITGLAQVYAGYAEGMMATKRKARYDKIYLERQTWRLDLLIFAQTIRVVLTGFGAR